MPLHPCVAQSILMIACYMMQFATCSADDADRVDQLASTNSPYRISGSPGKQQVTAGDAYTPAESKRVREEVQKVADDWQIPSLSVSRDDRNASKRFHPIDTRTRKLGSVQQYPNATGRGAVRAASRM